MTLRRMSDKKIKLSVSGAVESVVEFLAAVRDGVEESDEEIEQSYDESFIDDGESISSDEDTIMEESELESQE